MSVWVDLSGGCAAGGFGDGTGGLGLVIDAGVQGCGGVAGDGFPRLVYCD